VRSVGTAILDSEVGWVIRIAPHAMVRLKRVFARVPQYAADAVSLEATPENCRELLWFTERYPMDVDPRAVLETRAAEFDHRQAEIERILSGAYVAPEVALALPARDYQKVGAALAVRSGALLLADDLGVGKTVTAIAALAMSGAYPALVVTYSHLTIQWEREVRRFLPGVTVHCLRGTRPYDLTQGAGAPDVIICNYHKLAGWAPILADFVKSVVFDECQELRISESLKWNAARAIASGKRLRMGLSATPVYNYGSEIHSIMTVLWPDAIGSRAEFTREWCPDGESVAQPRALGSYLYSRGIMLRRTRRDIGRELPPVQRIVHTIDADPKILAKAETRAAELARIILGETTQRGAKWQASEEISSLVRQATGLAKAPYVAAFVRMLVEHGEPLILYGWHRAVYDLWADMLKDLRPAFFTGHESPQQKEASRQRFVDGGTKLMILSLRAGAGLDGLQSVCSTVAFGELDWSPGVHQQCIGRVDRDGQTRPVAAYFLTADSGSDPVVIDVLGLKAAQAHGIRDPSADVLEQTQVDPDHVRRLAEHYLRKTGAAAPDAPVSPPHQLSLKAPQP
jgi:SNF2 family DNA or RNA helicase